MVYLLFNASYRVISEQALINALYKFILYPYTPVIYHISYKLLNLDHSFFFFFSSFHFISFLVCTTPKTKNKQIKSRCKCSLKLDSIITFTFFLLHFFHNSSERPISGFFRRKNILTVFLSKATTNTRSLKL